MDRPSRNKRTSGFTTSAILYNTVRLLGMWHVIGGVAGGAHVMKSSGAPALELGVVG